MTAFTDRWWGGLTEQTRADDERIGLPLYRYLELIGHQITELADLAARIDYLPADQGGDGAPSELMDPQLADPAWLPWLAQIRGIRLPTGTVQGQRDALSGAVAGGYLIGTAGHIAQAARTVLTGSRYVRVLKHWGDDPLVVMVRTRTSETPDPDLVLDAIVEKGAKPAGVELQASTYEASWDTIEAAFPTWDARDAVSWDEIEEYGAPSG